MKCKHPVSNLTRKLKSLGFSSWDEEKVQVSVPRNEVPIGGRWVDAVGFGCLLMHTRVLKGLDFPWFFCNSEYDYPEDVGLCMRAGEAGFRVWLHGGVEYIHIGLQELTMDDER